MEYEELRGLVYRSLTVGKGGAAARIVDWCIGLLIVCNVLAVVVGTVDGVPERYGSVLYAFEVGSVVVFTFEYVLRVWSCTAGERYTRPVRGRLRFVSRPYPVIDLLAVLPFYLGAIALVGDLRVLRALRLVRFLRLFKLVRYAESFERLVRVCRRKRDDLVTGLVVSAVLLLVASSLLYFAEHGAQPRKFSSIPAALWWGVVTLTTVGYGDVYPVTPLGRVLGSLVATLGVGLFALPASVLASGFLEDADSQGRGNGSGHEREQEDATSPECPHCGRTLGERPRR